MGWQFCENSEGRPCGYGVGATCDEPDCDAKIDRGLSYVCGNMHDGGEYGCGDYFCPAHLYMTEVGQLCARCRNRFYIETQGDERKIEEERK
jgi:hypothetical protein